MSADKNTAYQLIIVSGPNKGSVYQLTDPEMTVGRLSEVEITINDSELSRRHAKLVLQGDNYILEDLGSMNGTFLNGERISNPRLLQPGVLIGFGRRVILKFEEK